MKLGNVVRVKDNVEGWHGGNWHNVIAVATPPKEPDYPFCFQIVTRPVDNHWSHEYFHIREDKLTDLVVMGHIDV